MGQRGISPNISNYSSLTQISKGAWLFDPQHREAKSEYALTLIEHGKPVTSIMDRSFVDANGIRWIIDRLWGQVLQDNIRMNSFSEQCDCARACRVTLRMCDVCAPKAC